MVLNGYRFSGSKRVSFQWFRNVVTKEDVMPEHLVNLLFANLDPIYEFHCSFLKEIEQRLAMW